MKKYDYDDLLAIVAFGLLGAVIFGIYVLGSHSTCPTIVTGVLMLFQTWAILLLSFIK